MIADPVAISISQTSDLLPYQSVMLNFSTSLSDGHCPGDYFTISLPAQLAAQNGNSYPLTDPSGATVATMTVVDGQAIVTLKDFVLTHQSVKLNGYLSVEIQPGLTPGGSTNIVFKVNGIQTKPTTITIGTCPGPGCTTTLPTEASKWGYVDVNGNVMVTFQTTPSTAAGQKFTIVDQLTSPGQQFPCKSNNVTGQYFTSLDAFGDPTSYTDIPVKVTKCGQKMETVTVTSTAAGQVFRAYVPITVTNQNLTSWSDKATVTNADKTSGQVSTVVKRADGGGHGTGIIPVATPPVTPPITTPPVTPPASSSSTIAVAATTSVSPPAGGKAMAASLAYTGLPGYALLIAAGIMLMAGVALTTIGRRRTRN